MSDKTFRRLAEARTEMTAGKNPMGATRQVPPDVPPSPDVPQERILQKTQAYKVLFKLGCVDATGGILHQYFRATYAEDQIVEREVVYRIDSVNAYRITLTYVENGKVLPSQFSNTEHPFWHVRHFKKATEVEWKAGSKT